MNIDITFNDRSTELVRNVDQVQHKDGWLVLMDRQGKMIKTFSSQAVRSYKEDAY